MIGPFNDGVHVLRPTRPDDVDNGQLLPGEVFTSDEHGLDIRFDGYSGGNCKLTINEAGTLRWTAVTIVSRPPIDVERAPLYGVSPDIFGCPPYCLTKPTAPKVPEPLGAGGGPWIGHDTLVGVRVHNLGNAPAHNVRVHVRVRQPLSFVVTCGGPSQGQAIETRQFHPSRRASMRLPGRTGARAAMTQSSRQPLRRRRATAANYPSRQ